MPNLQMISIGSLRESADNPRRRFNAERMHELTESVKERGVLNPLLVRPIGDGYEILAGARRFRAARSAGLNELPAISMDVSDDEALEILVFENDHREDVHPLEQALGYKALLDRPGYDIAALKAKIARSETFIYQRLKLLDLIEAARVKFLADEITIGHAFLIARLQPKDQEMALKECFRDDWGQPMEESNSEDFHLCSIRQLSEWIDGEIHLDLKAAPFRTSDEKLIPGIPACLNCPKRTGFIPALFPDIAKKDTCTDRACFHAKIEAHIKKKRDEAEKKGKPLVPVSSDWNTTDKSLLASKDYITVEGEKCDHCKSAIVVEGRNTGKTIEICCHPKCRVHGKSAQTSSNDWKTEDKKKKEAAKTEADFRKGLLKEIISRVGLQMVREDWELILQTLVAATGSARDIAGRYKWQAEKGEFSDSDYRATFSKNMHSLPLKDVFRLLIECCLIGETQVSPYNMGRPVLLQATAARYGIDIETLQGKTKAGKSETKPRKHKTKSK